LAVDLQAACASCPALRDPGDSLARINRATLEKGPSY